MSNKFKGFERIRKAMAMGAAGTVGLLSFGVGTGRANNETIKVRSAITTGTTYVLSSINNSEVKATNVLLSTSIVSTDVGETGTTTSGAFTIKDTTRAYGISEASIAGLTGTWNGNNYLGNFSQGTWGVPVIVTSSSASSFTSTPTALYDAFDGYAGIFVDGAPYNDLDGSVDVTGKTVTTHARAMPNGLVVSSQYYGFSNKRLGRIIFTINNPTGSSISPRIAIGGNLGSDSSTYVAKTSNGNQTVETGDNWVITHDDGVYGGVATNDPILTHIVGGNSAGVRPFPILIPGNSTPAPKSLTHVPIKILDNNIGNVVASGAPNPDDISFGYDLVIPAGDTQYITWFVQLSASMTETNASLPDYSDEPSAMAAGLFINLPPGMVGGGANWAAAAPMPIPVFSPISLLVLSGLFGFAATRRLRKIK